MQGVNVLRDHSDLSTLRQEAGLQLGDGFVGGVGEFGARRLAPVAVELPDQRGVLREGLWRRQLLGLVDTPVASSSSAVVGVRVHSWSQLLKHSCKSTAFGLQESK